MAEKSLLVLNQNVSGMNQFLFKYLKKNWQMQTHDIPYPKSFRWEAALKTIHPSLHTWRQRHFTEHMRLMGSVRSFKIRSEYAQKVVARNQSGADIIFQISGSFNGIARTDLPGALFLSFTTLLAYNEWRPWANFKTGQEFQQWFELEKALYQKLELLLCTNDYVRQCLVRDYGVKPERTRVIGYGVNFDQMPRFEKNPASQKILFVGYDFERKGGLQVLQAFEKVRKAVPGAVLQIVGPAFLPVPVPAGVEFYGTVSDRQRIAEFFQQARFFVMPSVCEPFGLVLLEAMAYQNPCIGSNRNAMPEIIHDGVTGYTVAPDDSEALASRMITLLKNPDLCTMMGQAALQRVLANFTWELTTQKINFEFEKLAEAGANA
jgi:glycosyltransferase involved in cell wall biosynthesis